jgi:hypothetical protein
MSARAAVLQAGLYEGAAGWLVLALLNGRHWLWLVLWELWLMWLAGSCLSSSSNSTASSSSGCSASGRACGTVVRATQMNSSSSSSSSMPSWKRLFGASASNAIGAGAAHAPESSTAGQGQPRARQGFWVDSLPLPRAASKLLPFGSPQAPNAAAAAAAAANTSSSNSGGSSDSIGSSGSGVVSVLLHRAGLALLHLGLPVVLAAAGLWS